MTPTNHSRRGVAVAVLVLMLAAIQVLVIAGIAGSSDDSERAVQRLLAVRARYAADGAGAVVARQARDLLTLPTTGSTLTIGSATVSFVSVPVLGAAGTAEISARADTATRRIRIDLSYPN